MYGERAEKRGHTGKEYWKSRLAPGGEAPGRITKTLTHKKERRAIKQNMHTLKQGIDSLGQHIEYQLINEEEKWIPDLDYY